MMTDDEHHHHHDSSSSIVCASPGLIRVVEHTMAMLLPFLKRPFIPSTILVVLLPFPIRLIEGMLSYIPASSSSSSKHMVI